jgi:hypothetical protein
MAIYHYKCPKCEAFRRVISTGVPSPPECECGDSMVRAPQPPTTTIKETLDNGCMPKAIERFSEAEELYKSRAKGK